MSTRPLRDKLEIQRAHDLLVGVLTGNCPRAKIPEDALAIMKASTTALCWVLRHEHNDLFARLLELVEAETKAAGYSIRLGHGEGPPIPPL